MKETIIKIDHVSKEYRLGAIGGGTLYGDLQSWWAKVRKKEDPNRKIGEGTHNERFLALDGVSFEIRKGERVGIIGHNGAGKSTLLKLLSRVTAPSCGTISYNGRIASMLEVGTGFHPEMTGRENVYMNGAILGMTKSEIDKKMDQIIEFSECKQFIDTPVKRYSSGMYVKLAFAVAAHLDSEILIMDEVLAVGDMKFQQKCLGKMDDVSKNEGRTILYVSHNMNTVKQLCDRCILLDRGKVVYDGNVDDGIARYLGVNGENAMTFNLAELHRSSDNSYLSQRAILEQLQIVNTDLPCYTSEENLEAELRWKALEKCENVFARFVFKYSDSTPLGFATTIEPVTVEKGETGHMRLRIPLTNFATGSYYSSICLYKSITGGGHDIVDSVDCGLRFQVENCSKESNQLPTGAQHRFWGHTVLPSIDIVRE